MKKYKFQFWVGRNKFRSRLGNIGIRHQHQLCRQSAALWPAGLGSKAQASLTTRIQTGQTRARAGNRQASDGDERFLGKVAAMTRVSADEKTAISNTLNIQISAMSHENKNFSRHGYHYAKKRHQIHHRFLSHLYARRATGQCHSHHGRDG